MTKVSEPSSNLASLAEGGWEWGGVREAQWEPLSEVKLACGLMRRQAEQTLQPNRPGHSQGRQITAFKAFLVKERSKRF